VVLAGFALPMCPEFEPSLVRLSPPRCLTCLLGLQDVQWVWGLVVVRISWPGHSELSKKKEKKNNNMGKLFACIFIFIFSFYLED
jgi:hypothetical protein